MREWGLDRDRQFDVNRGLLRHGHEGQIIMSHGHGWTFCCPLRHKGLRKNVHVVHGQKWTFSGFF